MFCNLAQKYFGQNRPLKVYSNLTKWQLDKTDLEAYFSVILTFTTLCNCTNFN